MVELVGGGSFINRNFPVLFLFKKINKQMECAIEKWEPVGKQPIAVSSDVELKLEQFIYRKILTVLLTYYNIMNE